MGVKSVISQVSPQIPNESENASVDRGKRGREIENKIRPCTLYEHFLRPFVTAMKLPSTS